MVQNHWTILKNKHFSWFWSFAKTMKKLCQMGSRKSCFGIPNGDMGLPGSTYPLILKVLVWCPKTMIFGYPPAGQQIRIVGSFFVSGRVCRERNTTFGQQGSQGGTLFAHEKLREKIQGTKRDLKRQRQEARLFFQIQYYWKRGHIYQRVLLVSMASLWRA